MRVEKSQIKGYIFFKAIRNKKRCSNSQKKTGTFAMPAQMRFTVLNYFTSK